MDKARMEKNSTGGRSRESLVYGGNNDGACGQGKRIPWKGEHQENNENNKEPFHYVRKAKRLLMKNDTDESIDHWQSRRKDIGSSGSESRRHDWINHVTEKKNQKDISSHDHGILSSFLSLLYLQFQPRMTPQLSGQQ